MDNALLSLFAKGGPLMYPLLLVSILVTAIVLERAAFLFRLMKQRSKSDVREIFSLVERGRCEEALSCAERSKDFLARVLAAALRERDTGYTAALLAAASDELRAFQRGLPLLDTAITIAPLLGLLGTVVGMIHSFGMVAGNIDAPTAITGGVAEALIATAFGLLVAILALVPFNYLNARLEDARGELETAGNRLELLLTKQGAGSGPNPPPTAAN